MSATHDDYINMRLLVDVAEHNNDHVALTKLREYVERIEALDDARLAVRARLPIKPLRIADCLPQFTAQRGGITVYSLAQDFSGEAERLAAKRDGVIQLFQVINRIQWGKGVNDVSHDDLDAIQAVLDAARTKMPPPIVTQEQP